MKNHKKRNYKALELIADDLVESIRKACWVNEWKSNNLSHPTAHMETAVNNYLAWKSLYNMSSK